MIFLSRTIVYFIRRAFQYGEKFHFHPFTWNVRENCLEVERSTRKRTIWKINVLLCYLNITFVFGRYLQLELDPTSSTGRKVYMQYATVFFLFPPLFQTVIILHQDDLCQLLSHFFRLMRAFEQKTGSVEVGEKTKTKMIKVGEVIVAGVLYVFMVMTPVFLLTVAARQNSPEYLTSILPPTKDANGRWPLRFLVGRSILFVGQSYYAYMYSFLSLIWIIPPFAIMFSSNAVLGQLKVKLENPNKIITSQEISELLDMYLNLQILIKDFNTVYCSFFMPMTKLILMWSVSFSIFSVIRLGGIIAVFLGPAGVLMGSILAVFLAGPAGFYTQSTTLLQLLKSPHVSARTSLYQRKWVASLVPIKVKIGSCYFIDRLLILTVLQTILDTTVNFLIAVP